MLFINEEDWLVNGIDENEAEFITKLHSLNDAKVFDYTYEIEECHNKVIFNKQEFKVIDYGVRQSYGSDESRFYILAEPAS